MQILKTLSRSVLLTPCFVLALYGCGSSGGGGDSDSGVDPTLQITRTNAGTVASAGYGANDDIGNVADVPGAILFSDTADRLRASGLLGVVLRMLPHTSIGKQAVAPAGLNEDPCLTGAADAVVNDSNGNDTLDQEGESASITFANCVTDNGGPTINGTMTFSLDQADDNEFEFTLGFTNLTIVGGIDDENLSANGGLTLGLEVIEEPFTLILSLRGDDLLLLEDGVPIGLVGDFEFIVTVSQGQSSAKFTVSVDVATLGIVNVTTTVALVGDPPTSGTIVIDGVDSTLTLTFTGAGGVTVALDEDGDGTVDCSQDLTVDTVDQFNPAACPP